MLPNSPETLAWLDQGTPGLLSIVIPAHNEANNLPETIGQIAETLIKENITHEIVVVNDNSSDTTEQVLLQLIEQYPALRYVNNQPPNGFGFAVRKGLQSFLGDAVMIVMADGSDAPKDMVSMYRTLQQGYDCVFGTRFTKNARIVDYPLHKKIINRMANWFIQLLFQLKYNDTTNAFKCYRRQVIAGLQPFLSHHFNLTVELPLKAIVRGYRYAVVPTDWYNRKHGISKLKIREMGSRYLFIVLYCLIEKFLSRGDYSQKEKNVNTPKF